MSQKEHSLIYIAQVKTQNLISATPMSIWCKTTKVNGVNPALLWCELKPLSGPKFARLVFREDNF